MRRYRLLYTKTWMLLYLIFQYSTIQSKKNNLYLEVDSTGRGSPVFLKEQSQGKNQQWRNDTATGTFRTKQNDYCMDIQGKAFNFRIRL